jgi:hypothetical protein
MKRKTPHKLDLLYAMREIDSVLTKRDEPAHITLGRIDYWVNWALRPAAAAPISLTTISTEKIPTTPDEK